MADIFEVGIVGSGIMGAGLAEVAHGQEWIEGYARAAGVARGVATLLGAVLVLATLLIVMNTIRLAVYARTDELDILAVLSYWMCGRVTSCSASV